VDGRFLEAFFNEPYHRVCGRRLRPLCLYHSLFLIVDDNPLHACKEGDAVTWTDLITASLVCSAPDASLRHRQFLPRGFVGRMMAMVWMSTVRHRFKLAMELAKFEAYLKDYSARPKFWTDVDGEPGTVKAPWILSILTFLEDHTNSSEHEILSMPIGWALWKSASLAEQLGMNRSEIVSEDEENAIAALKALG
jgi:hypothetical protein